MGWTTPATFATNEVLTAAKMNTHVRDNVAFLGSPPSCSVRNSTSVSVANNTQTVLAANTEAFDTDSMHSTVTNTSRITATTGGRYMFSATVRYGSNATGIRILSFYVNATTLYEMVAVNPSSGSDTVLSGTRAFVLSATDFVEVRVLQTAGGNLDVLLDDFTAVLVGV